ncbi:MAG: hypothetical protein L3J03_06220 [Desulfobacterales bacterium]|nr:hypothetical protein [Desulfobacterales bacterium]
MEYKDGSWQKLSSSSDEILLPHTLPDGFRFKLNLAGEEVDFGKSVLDEDEKNKTPTGIFLLSSGDITPFEITIIDRCSGKNRILSNLEDGCIRLISGQSSLAATNR